MKFVQKSVNSPIVVLVGIQKKKKNHTFFFVYYLLSLFFQIKFIEKNNFFHYFIFYFYSKFVKRETRKKRHFVCNLKFISMMFRIQRSNSAFILDYYFQNMVFVLSAYTIKFMRIQFRMHSKLLGACLRNH